jgi:hypothetical protein
LNVIDVAEVLKPLLKFIPVPPGLITYVALAIGLFDNPLAVAIALTVVVVLATKLVVYSCVVPAPGLGVDPSVV